MSFLRNLISSKSCLRKTDTVVLKQDGRRFIESRDSSGNEQTTLIQSSRMLGYIPDNKPDMQIAKIISGLYLGAMDVATDYSLLKLNGITHVLNVSSLSTDHTDSQIVYKHVRIDDLPETDIVSYFPECFNYIDDAVQSGGSVYVHCMAGVSRSPSIVIGYLMRTKQMKYQKAYDHVRSHRPVINPNTGFVQQLKAYKPVS